MATPSNLDAAVLHVMLERMHEEVHLEGKRHHDPILVLEFLVAARPHGDNGRVHVLAIIRPPVPMRLQGPSREFPDTMTPPPGELKKHWPLSLRSAAAAH